MNYKRMKLLILTMAITSLSYATDSNSFSSIESSQFNFDPNQSATGLHGSGEFYYNQITPNTGEVIGNEYFGNLNIKYKNEESKAESDKYFEFKARHNNESSFMFSVPEAYISFSVKHGDKNEITTENKTVEADSSKLNSKYYLGRVVLPWSKADENWGFGKLNNRINFDGFSPGQEGLVGMRYVLNLNKFFSVEAFLSYIYIPELNPSQEINEDDGTVKCKNPWCNEQADSAEISAGNPRPIFYDVQIPDLANIVFNASIGLRAAYKIELNNNKKLVFDGFYIRKPENVISTNVDVEYNPSTQIINANVDPEVYYHSVFGGNIKFDLNKNLKVYGTALAVRPDENPVLTGKVKEYLNIKPKKITEEYVGSGIEFSDGKTVSSIGYIARLSRFEIDDDPLIEYPRWNQAIHFNIGTKFTRKVSLALDYKYDTLTEDRLTMLKASYLVSSDFITSLGVNMIGSAKDENSYWSKFTNNDAFYGALKYTY